MKKIVIVLALLAFSLSASAQFYVGGGLGLSYSSAAETVVFKAVPEFGYSFKNMSVGMQVGIGATQDVTQFEVTPYFRYGFAQLGPVTFFGEAFASFGTIEEVSLFAFGLRPGFSVDMGRNLSLVSRFGQVSYSSVGESNDFVFSVDMTSTSLGFIYSF